MRRTEIGYKTADKQQFIHDINGDGSKTAKS